MNTLRKTIRILSDPAMIVSYGRWLRARVGGQGPYVPSAQGCKISLHWINFSEYWSFRHGISENERRFLDLCWERRASAPPIAMDIGANLGLFTLEMAARGFVVHSFEPAPQTFRRLSENVAASGVQQLVTLNQTAVGDREGQADFLVDVVSPATNRFASRSGLAKTTDERVAVRVVTIDSYMAENRLTGLEVLKVNVEGFEAMVLHGAQDALRRKAIRAILFELCPVLLTRAGETVAGLCAPLTDLGYGVFRLAEDGGCGNAMTPADMEKVSLSNLLAMPM